MSLPNSRINSNHTLLRIMRPAFLWPALLVSLAGMIYLTPGRGWDADVSYRGMQALRAGQDPYISFLALEETAPQDVNRYVYPPATLLALRAFNLPPAWAAAALYWSLYAAAFASLAWSAAKCFRPEDRPFMRCAIPLAAFFPGLMVGDVILSGNIACIFYGLVFPAAFLGWKYGTWRWFYIALLFASGFKLPLLTLLAIPVLAGERQWLRATAVATAGIGFLALQSWLWPTLFHEYLANVGLSSFGLSPAGIVGLMLHRSNLPWRTPAVAAYLICAPVVFAILLRFSRMYAARRISALSWIPVLFVGAVLLNPRIMQYDLLAVTIPMALIVLRSVVSYSKVGIALAAAVVLLIAIDLAGLSPVRADDLRNMLVLVAVMACGLHYLAVESKTNEIGSPA